MFRTLGLAGLIALCATPAAEAFDVIKKKQEVKAASRWTLGEWLETKDRIKIMDFWLALHSPSPFEFIFMGNTQWITYSPTPSVSTGLEFSATAYASIFGLEYNWENTNALRQTAFFHLRILGPQDQGTNITFNLGLRNQSEDGGLRSLVIGGQLTLYISQFFGIEAMLNSIQDSGQGPSGLSVGGSRFHAGAFVEFGFLRVFGRYIVENENRKFNGTLIGVTSHSGLAAGLQVYL